LKNIDKLKSDDIIGKEQEIKIMPEKGEKGYRKKAKDLSKIK